MWFVEVRVGINVRILVSFMEVRFVFYNYLLKLIEVFLIEIRNLI